MTTGFLDVRGAAVYFEEAGSGPSVVLVHPAIADSRMWDQQFGLLAMSHRVLRYDLPGCGQSTPTAGPIVAWRDLAAILDARSMAPAHLVGMSLGAAAVARFALEHPSRTITLSLVAPTFAATRVSPAVARFRALEEAALDRGDLQRVLHLNRSIWVAGPHRRYEGLRLDFRHRVEPIVASAVSRWRSQGRPRFEGPPALDRQLGRLFAPTLVVHGDQDVDEVLESGERLAAELPNARRVVVPGAAHFVNMEQPGTFNQALVGFLRDVCAPESR